MCGWSHRFWSCAVALAALVLSGCGKRESAATTVATPQILRLSQRNEPADLDPVKSALPDEFFIIRALSEGLLIPDSAGGAPLPGAAERWEVSPDGLVYTFHLRAGAKWSNGEPLTADDFVASYQRLLTPATAAPKADLFFPVKNARAFVSGAITDFSAVGFRATDSLTFVVTLERPNPQFPLYAASGPWIPSNPRVVAKHGRNWTRPENFVGNGPFLLAEWRARQRIVVKKNPGYHGAADVRLDEIQFIAFDDGDTEERAYRAGQIDVTMAVPFTKLETYARERPEELHRTMLAETRYLSFNTRHAPLDRPQVRRALSLAIDRMKIVERIRRGGQQPAWRFLPPALQPDGGRAADTDGKDGFNPNEARRLLADAGFPAGKNFPKLELTGWAQTPVLEALQEMWRQELGIEVTIAVRELKVHFNALSTGDYDIAFVARIPDLADASVMLEDFMADASDNFPHWSDSRYTSLILEARRAGTPAGRASALLAAEKRLAEECPVAPVYFNTKNWLMSPRVHGWREDALWTRDYRGIWLEEKSP